MCLNAFLTEIRLRRQHFNRWGHSWLKCLASSMTSLCSMRYVMLLLHVFVAPVLELWLNDTNPCCLCQLVEDTLEAAPGPVDIQGLVQDVVSQ